MIASKRRDASILSRAGTEFEPGLALHLKRRGGAQVLADKAALPYAFICI